MSTNLIPENVYRVKGVRAEFGESSAKGTPYVRVLIEIQDDGPEKGRRVSKDLWMTDKTWEKSIEALRCLGWQGDDVTNLRGIDTQLAAAKIVQEMVRNRDDSIKTDTDGNAICRNEVAWIGKDNAPKAMEGAKLSSFRELMKARIQQLGGPVEQPTKNGAIDDIPF